MSDREEAHLNNYETLKEFNLVSWSILEYGFNRGWVSKANISDYATGLVAKTSEHLKDNFLIALDAEYREESELNGALQELKNLDLNCLDSATSWRFVKLLELRDSGLSEIVKIDKLQELYATFDYPLDMRPCSIYSDDGMDPLAAMEDVIRRLERQILGL